MKSGRKAAPGASPAPLIPPAWWLAGLLVLATIALYWPALQNGFVNYDDDRYVTANARVQSGLTLANIGWAFMNPVADNWHPLTVLSYMLVCQFWGLNPWGHHLVSVLIHAVNGALVFVLLRQLTGSLWKSFFVAALFAFHPLRVESVAWVAERKDVLSGLFGLLALIFYARHAEAQPARREGHRLNFSGAYWASLVCFALGLMSKPMLVTLPFVLLLLDYWPLRRISNFQPTVSTSDTGKSQPLSMAKLVLEKIPFFALAAAVSVVTFIVQWKGEAVETMQNLPLLARCENTLVSYCGYLGEIFWPTDLAVFYPHPGHWPMGAVLLAAGFLVGLTVLVIWLRRRQPYLLVGCLWFVGMLVPVIGLVQVGLQSMADRYTYLPSLGVLIMIVWGAEAVTGSWPQRKVALGVAGVAATAVCMALTLRQLPYWEDSESLFRHAIAVTGDNPIAHYNLATALDADERSDEAIREYNTVLQLQPENTLALLNLGGDLYKAGDGEGAKSKYAEVIRLEPRNAKAHNDLGIVLFKEGNTSEAIKEFEEAVRLSPDNASAHNSLAAALFTQGQTDQALTEFHEALRLRPDYAEAHFNLGCILANRGQTSEAIKHFQEALRLNPDYTEAQDWLAKVLKTPTNSN